MKILEKKINVERLSTRDYEAAYAASMVAVASWEWLTQKKKKVPLSPPVKNKTKQNKTKQTKTKKKNEK